MAALYNQDPYTRFVHCSLLYSIQSHGEIQFLCLATQDVLFLAMFFVLCTDLSVGQNRNGIQRRRRLKTFLLLPPQNISLW